MDIFQNPAITKIDEVGSNCPKHYDLIMEYESGNLNKKPNIYMFFISLLLGVSSIVLSVAYVMGENVS